MNIQQGNEILSAAKNGDVTTAIKLLRELVEPLEQEINLLQQQLGSGWVSVDECLLLEGVQVLMLFPDNYLASGRIYDAGYGRYHYLGSGFDSYQFEPTHWMPLPKGPSND